MIRPRFFYIGIFSYSFLIGSDSALVLPIKREIYETQKKIIKINESSNYLNLISPVSISAGISNSDSFGIQSQSTYQEISFSQDIFRSGGLYKSVEYNKKNTSVFNLELDINFNILKRNIFILAKRLDGIELDIRSTELSLKNAIIDYERKNEQHKNGVLDFSFVNNAIIERERNFNSIIDLKRQKNELEYQLSNLSSKEHQDVPKTELEFPPYYSFFKDSRLFLDENKIQLQEIYNQLTFSSYLPRISFSTSFRHSESDIPNPFPNSVYTGLRLTVPLHPNAYFINESNRINLLKSKSELTNNRSELEKKYYLQKANYTLLDQKIEHLSTMIIATSNLVALSDEQFNNGLINQFDLEMVKNTNEIYKLSLSKVKIEKDLIILNLLLDMRSK